MIALDFLSFNTLKPPFLFAVSATVTTLALHFPPRFHGLLLLPAWLLAVWSLVSVDGDTTATSTGLDSYTAITSFIFMLILPNILPGQSQILGAQRDQRHQQRFVWPTRQTISAACGIWNNPRHLILHKASYTTWSSRVSFAIDRAAKVGKIIIVDRWIIQLVRRSLVGDLLDFTPDKHPIIRPVLHQFLLGCNHDDCLYGPVTYRQLSLRAFTAFSWLWSNYYMLQSYHAILSITFVALGIDNPDSWPPLFGSIADASTIQGFWGRFWHRIATPTFVTWTLRILRMKLPPQTAGGKLAVAFGVFFMSGVMHMTAAWRTGEGFAHLDLAFFCANFFAIAAEMIVSRLIKGLLRGTRLGLWLDGRGRFLHRISGYIWVLAWFFWAAPRWLYPKIMRGLIKKALTESRTSP